MTSLMGTRNRISRLVFTVATVAVLRCFRLESKRSKKDLP